jgi:hypothetical protein
MESEMKAPECPDHGDNLLEYALGRLADAPAADAERIRESCPVCGEWWDRCLSPDETAAVDAAVAEAFASYSPSGRRKAPVWIASAAAIVIAVGAGLLWHAASAPPDVGPAELVESVFEGAMYDHDLNGDGVVDASDLVRSLIPDR